MANGDVNRWTWIFNILVPAATGAIVAYAAIQVNTVRIEELEEHTKEHRALQGHPGISEKITALEREHDKHEKIDYMFYQDMTIRIEALEKRIRQCEIDAGKKSMLFDDDKFNLGG